MEGWDQPMSFGKKAKTNTKAAASASLQKQVAQTRREVSGTV
jgi:hypothetical protein